MKFILITSLSFLFFLSASAGQEEYDACILKHMKQVKIDVVAHLVQQACKENYKSAAFTSEKKKIFNECILENLEEVESIPAAMEIKDACNRKANRK
jgi:hypothetical protein